VVCRCVWFRNHKNPREWGGGQGPLRGYRTKRKKNVFPSTPLSSKWSLPLSFPPPNPVCTFPLPHSCHTPCPSNSVWSLEYYLMSECRSWSPCCAVSSRLLSCRLSLVQVSSLALRYRIPLGSSLDMTDHLCNKTKLMHCLSSVYFVIQPLHVSGIFVALHQEVYCIYVYNNWYVVCLYGLRWN